MEVNVLSKEAIENKIKYYKEKYPNYLEGSKVDFIIEAYTNILRNYELGTGHIEMMIASLQHIQNERLIPICRETIQIYKEILEGE